MEILILGIFATIVSALIVNRWLTLKYGSVPNQDLLQRVAELERIDTTRIEDKINEVDNRLSLQLKAVNKRIDGFVIGKLVHSNGFLKHPVE